MSLRDTQQLRPELQNMCSMIKVGKHRHRECTNHFYLTYFGLFTGLLWLFSSISHIYFVSCASMYMLLGEDRWLCTLLLQQGWRVEYNAASDAYTNSPQEFKEFYNQRRRWGPSTLANTLDLLHRLLIIIKQWSLHPWSDAFSLN